jgi:hypothetical protein
MCAIAERVRKDRAECRFGFDIIAAQSASIICALLLNKHRRARLIKEGL